MTARVAVEELDSVIASLESLDVPATGSRALALWGSGLRELIALLKAARETFSPEQVQALLSLAREIYALTLSIVGASAEGPQSLGVHAQALAPASILAVLQLLVQGLRLIRDLKQRA